MIETITLPADTLLYHISDREHPPEKPHRGKPMWLSTNSGLIASACMWGDNDRWMLAFYTKQPLSLLLLSAHDVHPPGGNASGTVFAEIATSFGQEYTHNDKHNIKLIRAIEADGWFVPDFNPNFDEVLLLRPNTALEHTKTVLLSPQESW